MEGEGRVRGEGVVEKDAVLVEMLDRETSLPQEREKRKVRTDRAEVSCGDISTVSRGAPMDARPDLVTMLKLARMYLRAKMAGLIEELPRSIKSRYAPWRVEARLVSAGFVYQTRSLRRSRSH